MRAVELTIRDTQWEENGTDDDPSARLMVTVCVNGTFHHLEAFAVENNEETHVQEAVVSAFENNLSGICEVAEPDGHWQTLKIMGRDYVLAMTPHC